MFGNFFRAILLFVVIFQNGGVFAENPRIVILSANEYTGWGDLLTAELSQAGFADLIERNSIDKLVNERNLTRAGLSVKEAIQWGSLLGADGVLVVDSHNTPTEELVLTRLISTRSSLLLGLWVNKKLEDPALWIEESKTEIESRLSALNLTREEGLPCTITGVYGESWQEKWLEVSFGDELSRALLAQEDIFLLDRQNISALQLEKNISNNTDPFWRASNLIEVSVSFQNGEYSCSAIITLPNKVQKTIKLTHSSLRLVAVSVAEKFHEIVGGESSLSLAPNPNEGNDFAEDALWASKQSLFRRALSSAEAAFALGVDTDELRYTMLNSTLDLAGIKTLEMNWEVTEPSATETISVLYRGFQDFDRLFIPSEMNSKEFSKWLTMGDRLMQAAAAELTRYFFCGKRTQEQESMYRSLRLEIRELAKKYFVEVKRRGAEYKSKHDVHPFDNGTYITLFGPYVKNLPLWFDDPEEWIEEFKFLLSFGRHFEKDPMKFKRFFFTERGYNRIPLVLYWNTNQKTSYEKEVKEYLIELSGSNSYRDRWAAVEFILTQYSRTQNKNIYKMFQQTPKEILSLGLDVWWGGRHQMASGHLHWFDFSNQMYSLLEWGEDLLSSPDFKLFKMLHTKKRLDFYVYFIANIQDDHPHKVKRVKNKYAQLAQPHEITVDRSYDEVMANYDKLIKAYPDQARRINKDRASYQRSFVDEGRDPKVQAALKDQLKTPIKKYPKVKVEYMYSELGTCVGIQKYRGDLYLTFYRIHSAWAWPKVHVVVLEEKGLAHKATIPFNPAGRNEENNREYELFTMTSPLAFIGDDIYLSTQSKIHVKEGGRDDWRELKLNGLSDSFIAGYKGILYGASRSGIVFSYDPRTKKQSTLASSRRKPPQNEVDKAGTHGRLIESGGRLHLTVKNRKLGSSKEFSFDPKSNMWTLEAHVKRRLGGLQSGDDKLDGLFTRPPDKRSGYGLVTSTSGGSDRWGIAHGTGPYFLVKMDGRGYPQQAGELFPEEPGLITSYNSLHGSNEGLLFIKPNRKGILVISGDALSGMGSDQP